MFRSRPAYALRARPPPASTTRFTTRSTIRSTTAALRLEPCGDGTVDHLPRGREGPAFPRRAARAAAAPRPPRRDAVGARAPRAIAGAPSRHRLRTTRAVPMDGDGRLFVTDRWKLNGTDVDGRRCPSRRRPSALDVGRVVNVGGIVNSRSSEWRNRVTRSRDALSTIREGAARRRRRRRAVGDARNAGASAAKKVGDVFARFGGKGGGDGNEAGNGNEKADSLSSDEVARGPGGGRVLGGGRALGRRRPDVVDSEPDVVDSRAGARRPLSRTPTPPPPTTARALPTTTISQSPFLSEARVMLTPRGLVRSGGGARRARVSRDAWKRPPGATRASS